MPLRLVLVVPFVIQIVAAVSLTGWLSLRNGHRAVNDVVEQLSNSVTARIDRHVRDYLNTPHLFLEINASAIRHDILAPDNFATLEANFWSQIQLDRAVTYLFLGDEFGNFIGVQQLPDGKTVVKFRTPDTAPERQIYQLDDLGRYAQFLEAKVYDPRLRPWYKAGQAAEQSTWSPIFPSAHLGVLQITAVVPIYTSDGEFRGVFGSNLILSQIDRFLQGLEIGQSGQAFIIERSGALVASSMSQEESIALANGVQRLLAAESNNPVVSQTVKALLERVETLEHVRQTQRFAYNLDGERQLVQVTPFQDGRGLDWLSIVVIPEADFTAQINAGTRTTIWLCLAALGGAIGFGLITSRWITQPIHRFSQASAAMARGKLEQKVNAEGIRELDVLAHSFNRMAEQLRESFTALATTKAQLETRVAERTASLAESQRALSTLMSNLPGMAYRCLSDRVWTMQFVSEGCYELTGHPPEELIDNAQLSYDDLIDPEDRERVRQEVRVALLEERPFKIVYRIQVATGDLKWVWEQGRGVYKPEQGIWSIEGFIADITDRKQSEEILKAEREKSEQLLLNILPEPIAQRLKQDQDAIAESFDEVTILFADIVGFTPLATRLRPTETVNLLNQIFSSFDYLAESMGLEKIKTIGDAYMVAAGLPLPHPDHAEAIADMALSMNTIVDQLEFEQGERFQLRIGINTGKVVAGVIGLKKFAYDLWGDTVNIASRMESSGEAGKIQVTSVTYERLKDWYFFEKRGEIQVKGKGTMTTYWLLGAK
ncbi:MAG: PAS domain-containing protein [Cyanobacteria bacterium SID2]|nr:PAS domain-containing protein [Cyanobacteria bacterium SID2]MBP0006565.1 PAS domain-containing protein [Cyanobacteria bacterium SBC]